MNDSRLIEIYSQFLAARSELRETYTLPTYHDFLGHAHVTTTQRYCKVSNLKVQRDYYAAIEVVMQRSQARERCREEEIS